MYNNQIANDMLRYRGIGTGNALDDMSKDLTS